MLEYEITAEVTPPDDAAAKVREYEIKFDATSSLIANNLPNPSELLLTSLAACILKNVQRYSERLHLPYRKAVIYVIGKRNDNPPFMSEITYKLEIDTDVERRKLVVWHKNILKFGTITNTLIRACKLEGTIDYLKG